MGWKEIGNLWRLAGDWGLKRTVSLCELKGFRTWKTLRNLYRLKGNGNLEGMGRLCLTARDELD